MALIGLEFPEIPGRNALSSKDALALKKEADQLDAAFNLAVQRRRKFDTEDQIVARALAVFRQFSRRGTEEEVSR